MGQIDLAGVSSGPPANLPTLIPPYYPTVMQGLGFTSVDGKTVRKTVIGESPTRSGGRRLLPRLRRSSDGGATDGGEGGKRIRVSEEGVAREKKRKMGFGPSADSVPLF